MATQNLPKELSRLNADLSMAVEAWDPEGAGSLGTT